MRRPVRVTVTFNLTVVNKAVGILAHQPLAGQRKGRQRPHNQSQQR